MARNSTFTRVLAVIGTTLLALPIIAAVGFAVIHLARSGQFMMDYMIPGEVFPMVLLGGSLLVWAAIRGRSRSTQIGWGLVVMVLALILSQAIAVATGLTSGAREATGWPWILTLGLLLLYDLAVAAVAVLGILLCRTLFRS